MFPPTFRSVTFVMCCFAPPVPAPALSMMPRKFFYRPCGFLSRTIDETPSTSLKMHDKRFLSTSTWEQMQHKKDALQDIRLKLVQVIEEQRKCRDIHRVLMLENEFQKLLKEDEAVKKELRIIITGITKDGLEKP